MHFVFKASGRVFLPAALTGCFCLTLSAAGCSPRSTPRPVEDSLTSGRISMVTAFEAEDMVTRGRDAFHGLYPQATLDLGRGSSRDAIGALFAAKCDLAIITRELDAEERSAAVRGKLDLEGYRFARDAVVAIVHADNPVQNLTVAELRRIYSGETRKWSEFGGRDETIVPITRPPASDLNECFMQQVMAGDEMRAHSIEAQTDSEVVARVRANPAAIGYVSLNWADRGARALEIAALKGLPYRKPDLEAVYEGRYPLTRFFNLYARASGPRLSNGFITYMTSFEGQKLVQESGLVPTAVPVRFVRRSPLLGTH
jgi:phosphate transport system substrate-binding protein